MSVVLWCKGVFGIVSVHDTSDTSQATSPFGRDQLPELIDRFTVAIESLRTQWRTYSDLGTHERMAIAQLRVYGPMPMSSLAARIALSRAAITSLTDRLEEDGWVRRVADEHDRRRTVLKLMPRAHDQYSKVTAEYNQELARWAARLTDDEWATLSAALSQMAGLTERTVNEMRSTAVERSLR